jgi:integration host factor subunit beta
MILLLVLVPRRREACFESLREAGFSPGPTGPFPETRRTFSSEAAEYMTKSELIERIAAKQPQLSVKDIELAVKTVLEHMSQTLASGERIEIRGFGSFSLHYREPRQGRNPKTGDTVELEGKHVPHFKPGKEMRERVNQSIQSA